MGERTGSSTARHGIRRLVPEDPAIARLALATLVATSGRGIFFTISALYFTRIIGFSAVEVGGGLSIAAGVGLLAGIPLGHLADRVGPREVQVALTSLLAVAIAAYLFVDQWWQFTVVATAISVLMAGAGAVRNSMIAGLARGSDRGSTKAYLRAVTNLGMSLGTGVAAIVLLVDTAVAYRTGMALHAVAAASSAALVWTLPHLPPASATERRSMLAATRDVPFLLVVLASAVLTMHFWILEFAMPLWVVEHTDAPRWLVSALIGFNTVAVIVAQVRVARQVTTIAAAGRATVLAGVTFLGGCLLLAAAGDLGAGAAAGMLVLGIVAVTAGELLQSAGGFVYSFELPPEHAMGQYQGVWGLTFGIASFVAPILMAALPLALGTPGWVALGAILLAASVGVVLAGRWAERTRDSATEIATAA